jgi:hypothetical protein
MLTYAIETPGAESLATEPVPAAELPALKAKARRLSRKIYKESGMDGPSVYLLAFDGSRAVGQFVYYGGILSWTEGQLN